MKIKLFFTLVVFTLTSCTSSNVKDKNQTSIPDWFLQTDISSNNIIYGSSSSPIKEDAIKNALSDAISKIKVVISSSTKSQSQLLNSITTDQIQTVTNTQIEDFSVSGYQVSNIFFDSKNKIFYVQVKIEKLKIFNEKLIYYNEEKSKLESNIKNIQNPATPLNEKLGIASTDLDKIKNLQGEMMILYSLNSSFNIQNEMKYLEKLKQIIQQFNRTIKFTFTSRDFIDLNNFAQIELGKAKFRIIANSKKDNTTVEISFLNYNTNKDKIYGKFIINSSVLIQFKNRGNVIFAKNLNFTGSSYVDYEGAQKQSLQNFSTQFSNTLKDLFKI
jgi:hypothetical protein